MTVIEQIAQAEQEAQKAIEMARQSQAQAARSEAEHARLLDDLAKLRQRLGLDAGSSKPLFESATSGSRSRTTKRNGNGSSTRKRRRMAKPGERGQQFLEEVRRTPGVSVAEIAGRFGVDATGLYRYARKFEEEGAVRKDGKQLFPMFSGEPQAGDNIGGSVPAADPEHIPT